MIVSASRRTDIPAFYTDWFFLRLDANYCLVPNPYNARSVTRVSLLEKDVDAFVFWTKNPGPLTKRLGELDDRGFRYYFQVTLTAYDDPLEPFVPAINRRIDAFLKLASALGPKRVVWRYDPILISNRTGYDFHEKTFRRMTEVLEGATQRVMISFASFYRKTLRRLGKLEPAGWKFDSQGGDRLKTRPFLSELAAVAHARGMRIYSCADERDFSDCGIEPGSCVDAALINELWHRGYPNRKDPGQRPFCRCAPSRDIGVNDTCVHGCTYCYSTCSHEVAKARNKAHDSTGESLWGKVFDT